MTRGWTGIRRSFTSPGGAPSTKAETVSMCDMLYFFGSCIWSEAISGNNRRFLLGALTYTAYRGGLLGVEAALGGAPKQRGSSVSISSR